MKTIGKAFLSGARDLIKSIQKNEVPVTAASMAYSTLFALIPLLLFLAALSGFVSRWIGADNTVEEVTDFLFRHLPDSSAAALEEPIEAILRRQTGGLLSVGAVLAIWGSRSMISGGVRAINRAYGIDKPRNWLEQNAISLGLTIGLGITAVIGSASVLLGSRWGDRTSDKFGVGEQFADIWSFSRWPLIGILLFGALVVFFRVAPATRISMRSVIPGALFSLVGWAIAIVALSYYFSIAGSYTAAYGIIGGILALIFWLYVMSMIFAIGAELNALFYRRSIKTSPPPTAIP
ncbi:YihY/virulence factor BrkB family protein [soil metagenome]